MKINKFKILSAGSLVLFVFFWWLIVELFQIREFFLPSPIVVSKSIFLLFFKGEFVNDIYVSVFRVITGFVVAAIIAVPLGIYMGRVRHVEAVVEPIVDFIRYTPVPAFIPLFILWFGIGELEKIVVIAASVFFQLILMIANDVSHIPQSVIHSAQTLGLGHIKIITKVVYPYAKPRIVDDLRISMGWAWAGLIMAEIVGSSSGIGYVIIQSQRLLQTSNVMAALVVVGCIGIIIDYSFKYMHKRVFPWARNMA